MMVKMSASDSTYPTSKATLISTLTNNSNSRYIDRLWGYLLQTYDSIDLTLGGALAIHTFTYWGAGLSLLMFEYGVPTIAGRYKTQPNQTVTARQLFKLLKRVIFNQILLAAGYFVIRKFRPKKLEDQLDKQCLRPPPSYQRICADYIFNLGVFEVVFYCLHRTLHDLRWYKYVHKIHHEFKAPIGLAAEYAHIIELVLSNIVPGAVGPAITNAHPISTYIWLFGSLVQTCFHHSGLMLPFYPLNSWTIAHDWHHAAFTDQFGVVGLMDTALKTTGDEAYVGFSNEIWTRMAAGTAGGALLTRVAASAAILGRRRARSNMPSQLFASFVR